MLYTYLICTCARLLMTNNFHIRLLLKSCPNYGFDCTYLICTNVDWLPVIVRLLSFPCSMYILSLIWTQNSKQVYYLCKGYPSHPRALPPTIPETFATYMLFLQLKSILLLPLLVVLCWYFHLHLHVVFPFHVEIYVVFTFGIYMLWYLYAFWKKYWNMYIFKISLGDI